MKSMTTKLPDPDASGSTLGPLMTSGVVAFMLAWLLMATGEALYGDLDGAVDLNDIADASVRFGAGALLQLLAAVMLAGGTAAVMMLIIGRAPKLARAGGWLTLTGAVGLGAFAQTHMLFLAMAHSTPDRVALNAFLAGPMSEAGGLWAVAIIIVILVLPIGLILLALGTAAAGLTSRWPALLIVAHVIIHLGFDDNGIIEVGSHFVLAAALFWMGWSILSSLGTAYSAMGFLRGPQGPPEKSEVERARAS
jgi:hypothetical protein